LKRTPARAGVRSLRRAFVLCVGIAGSSSGIAACAGLVGVEEVRLRRDSGFADVTEEPEELEETGGRDTGPKPLENILEVAPGDQHTCARKPDGTVKCWGSDLANQLGIGGDGGIYPTPVALAITDAVRISSGKNHSCVVHKTGKVSCWGDNNDGQLGNGLKNTRSATPVDVLNVAGAVGVACGANFSCALLGSGGASCWGNGLGGQLGNGSTQIQPTAQPVSMLSDAVAIAAGESHACAVKSGGTIVCWGDGINGQLGNGDQLPRTTPAGVNLKNVATVSAAQRSTCALLKDGAVHCWGANELGQVGSGAASQSPNPSPIVVSNLDKAIAVSAGAIHACAVKQGGLIVCWGNGYQGQLGDGTTRLDATTPQPSPVAVVQGTSRAIGVGTSGNHSCAPTTDGNILCWGENVHGELGTGVIGGQLQSPETVKTYP